MRITRRTVVALLALTAVQSCDLSRSDVEPTTPVVDAAGSLVAVPQGRGIDVAMPAVQEIPESIPELRIDGDVASFSRLMSDGKLVESVKRTDGLVVIGLKPLLADRTSSSSRIPAMSRAEIVEARQLLEQNGAELIRGFRYLSAVVARISPESAPSIRALPVVNYLAAPKQGAGAALPRVPPTKMTLGPAPYADQDTSWGVHKIGADSAWATWGNEGQWATITMIDYGVIQNQY